MTIRKFAAVMYVAALVTGCAGESKLQRSVDNFCAQVGETDPRCIEYRMALEFEAARQAEMRSEAMRRAGEAILRQNRGY